jgi:Zn-dependent protease
MLIMSMFYKNELIHIFISFFTISLAFYVLIMRMGGGVHPVTVFLAVGAGFVVHELAHKFVAMRFGCLAVFRAWMWGLVLAVIFALTSPFIFAAPGAVHVYKPGMTRKESGLISISGAFMNMLMGLFFLFMFAGTRFVELAFWGFHVNMFLGLFNMVPVPPLDGYDVLKWNTVVWGIFFVALIYLNFFFVGSPF